MQCPYCGTPNYTDSGRCGRCGGVLPAVPAGQTATPAPGWRPVVVPPKAGGAQEVTGCTQEAPRLATRQYLLLLVVGLLPLLGIFYSFSKAFGSGVDAERRSLAKAMLWVHGGALCVLLAGLCIWVLGLAAQLA